MKKIPFLALIVLFSMCKSASHIFAPEKKLTIEEKIEKIKEEDRLPEEKDVIDLPDYAQVRDDFRSVSDKTKEYSVVILTQGYKGEDIIIKNADKNFFKGMTMSDLQTGIAKSVRVENGQDFIIRDNYTDSEITIESDYAKMFKFIYIMKTSTNKENPFKVTFSNTLRPVR
jgi:hypothetical protein